MEELYGEWEKRISPLRSLPLRSLLLRSFFSMVRGLFGFKPHASLLRHEGYKILIVSRAMLILLVFGFLAGYSEWRQSYSLSAQETYYQSLMLQLEGGLTEEKEQLLLAEQRRYQEAFDRVSQIDRMVSEGEMTENAGENLKAECMQPAGVGLSPAACAVPGCGACGGGIGGLRALLPGT